MKTRARLSWLLNLLRTAGAILLAWGVLMACSGRSSIQRSERTGTSSAAVTSTVTISGQARNAAGAPLAGVAVKLTGAGQGTQTTDANGQYAFAGLATGSYTLQPTLFGCVFFPGLTTLNNLTGNAQQNFDGSGLTCGGLPSAHLAVTGIVSGAGGIPLPGVVVALIGPSPSVQTTGTAGTFSFGNLLPGGYVVQPALLGCTIPSASINLTDNTSLSLDGAGPTCPAPSPGGIAISGQVRNASGAPLVGATIVLAGPTLTSPQTSDANGNYAFPNLAPGSYLGTVALLGCAFVPPVASLANLSGNTIQNFDGAGVSCGGAAAANLTITGQISDANGLPLPGVNVQLLGASTPSQTTSSSGSFSFAHVAPGSYVVQPNLNGCTFDPTHVTLANLTDSAVLSLSGSGNSCGGALTANAGATSGPLTISGHVRDSSGNAVASARIDLTGSSLATRFTDWTGAYAFHVSAGSYSLLPSGACKLAPQLAIANVVASVVQDFAATGSGCLTASKAVVGAAGSSFIVNQGGQFVGQTYVHAEARTSTADALSRLQQIASERPGTVTSLTIGGNPAIQRSATITAVGAEGVSSGTSTTRVWVTTAIAAGSNVIRYESRLAGGATQATTNLFLNLGVNARIDGDPLAGPLPAAVPMVPVGSYTTVSTPLTSSPPTLIETKTGELQIAASDTANAVVYAAQNGPFFSINGSAAKAANGGNGLTPPANTCFPQDGDPQIAVGPPGTSGNATFYYSQLLRQSPSCQSGDPNLVAVYSSGDNGQTFSPTGSGFPVNCLNNKMCASPDQEQLVVDRKNKATASVGGSPLDQLYLAWRNADTNSDGYDGFTIALTCSRDGGLSWLDADYFTLTVGGADFPRMAVGPDGSLLVAYEYGDSIGANTPYTIYVQKFSSCANGLVAQYAKTVTSGGGPSVPPVTNTFPLPVIAASATTISDISGVDRRPRANYQPTFDDFDPTGNTAYLVYVNEPSAGSDDVHVVMSQSGGSTWLGDTVINTVSGGSRFFPAMCTTSGKKFVTWYDRRDDFPLSLGGNTSYYRSSFTTTSSGQVVRGTEFNVSAVDDPQCASGFPVAIESSNEELGCLSGLPEAGVPAGTCPVSGAACDFRFPGTCGAGNGCFTGRGIPKYGDYNGNACALGTLYMAWASATPPLGATCLPNGPACNVPTDCCSGNCVSGPGGGSTSCGPSAGACQGNGSTCSVGSACCSGNCEGGSCLPSISLWASATACLGPTCNQFQPPGDAGADAGDAGPPAFGVTVSASQTATGPNVCFATSGFTGRVQVQYFNIPVFGTQTGGPLSVLDGGVGNELFEDFSVDGDLTSQCTPNQLNNGTPPVTVQVTDVGTGNVATGTIPSNFFCFGGVPQNAQLNGGCPP